MDTEHIWARWRKGLEEVTRSLFEKKSDDAIFDIWNRTTADILESESDQAAVASWNAKTRSEKPAADVTHFNFSTFCETIATAMAMISFGEN